MWDCLFKGNIPHISNHVTLLNQKKENRLRRFYLGKMGSAHASMRLVCQWGQGQGQGFLVVGSEVRVKVKD